MTGQVARQLASPIAAQMGAAGGSALWSPANLTNPPGLAIDAARTDLFTKDGSNVLLSINTVYASVAGNTPALITHTAADSGMNNAPAFVAPGTAAQQLNFSTNLGGLLNNKGGCTMVFFGRFSNPAPSAFNSAIVNATTTSASSTRCSIASSPAVANCPRAVIRRLDADTANGDDIGSSNIGATPWIGILRQDNTGAIVGAGTPTKNMRICQGGNPLSDTSEATGLGSGNYSATNSAYIGFFNSGTVAQSLTNMHWGCIEDTVYTDVECQKLEGWLAWKIGRPDILPVAHPYRNAPPMVG
jgi:hypothetical protein